MKTVEFVISDFKDSQGELGVLLSNIETSSSARRKIFDFLMRSMRKNHPNKVEGYQDVGYVLSRVLEDFFPEKGVELCNLFYKDRLVEHSKSMWDYFPSQRT
ncbi:hypothetical protein [Marinimicrobium sp. LS-A18]|uniref:hypothetical protein n=1 Tax=Marinimicrobium sp. LS-A18 TaxID=1381596 RepID=UPI0012687F0F|nr:hypothetical protein [Marinimicrobium sp. LS-A18]